jgi:hypothetical protein
VNTHGLRIDFGKHKGELFTRLPVSYLRWMINEGTKQCEIAKAEFERRGDTMPKVELSGHAIDNASLRVRKIWHETRTENEGIYSWLERMVLEAIKCGDVVDHGAKAGELTAQKIIYNGMKFVIAEGEEFPALKTIMRIK